MLQTGMPPGSVLLTPLHPTSGSRCARMSLSISSPKVRKRELPLTPNTGFGSMVNSSCSRGSSSAAPIPMTPITMWLTSSLTWRKARIPSPCCCGISASMVSATKAAARRASFLMPISTASRCQVMPAGRRCYIRPSATPATQSPTSAFPSPISVLMPARISRDGRVGVLMIPLGRQPLSLARPHALPGTNSSSVPFRCGKTSASRTM